MRNAETTTRHQTNGKRRVFRDALWFLAGIGILGVLVYAIFSAPPVEVTGIRYTKIGKEVCEVDFTVTNTSSRTIRTQLGITVYAEGEDIPTESYRNPVRFVIGRKGVPIVLQPGQSEIVQTRVDILDYPFSPIQDVLVMAGRTQRLD